MAAVRVAAARAGAGNTGVVPAVLAPRSSARKGDIVPLIQLIVILIVIGLVLYLIESLLPIDPAIKQVIRVVLVLALILWLLSLVGLIPARIALLAVPRLRLLA